MYVNNFVDFFFQQCATDHVTLVLVMLPSKDGGITKQPMTVNHSYMAVAKAMRTTLKRDKPVCSDAGGGDVGFFVWH